MSAEQGLAEAPVQQAPQANGGEQSGGYELNEDGERVPHGMGQSKSSRRRRRKRKGKGPEGEGGSEASDGAENAGTNAGAIQGSAETQSSATAAAPAQPSQSRQGRSFDRQNNGQQNAGQQNNGQQNGAGQSAPGGTKRWKKKNFRERDRGPRQDHSGQQASGGGGFQQGAQQQNGYQQNGGGGFRGPDTHQPGNNSGGFKRKGGFGGGKQQNGGGGGRQRSGFVGPMDHSYRAPNGNIFDGSTVESSGFGGGRGRHTGDSQPIDYSQGRSVPIAEDAPTKIYFFIEDLFFTAKIQETARKLGVKVAFIKNEKEQIAAITGAEEEDRPGLIVFDLNNAAAKPLTLIPKLKTKLKKSTSIIGFLSHLQGDLKAKAVEAGCDTVMPRAAFSQNLPNLLRRYGIEDVEEQNYNQ